MGNKKMKTIFTSLFLIMIIASIQCNNKVTYAEIYSSLAEITNVPNGPQTVDVTQNNFRETYKLGQKYDQALTNQCRNIISRHQTNVRNNSIEKRKLYLAFRNMSIESGKIISKIRTTEADQKENQEKIENVKAEMQENLGKLQDQSTDFVQRQRVLKRLMYLINDELRGSQRESTERNKLKRSSCKFNDYYLDYDHQRQKKMFSPI